MEIALIIDSCFEGNFLAYVPFVFFIETGLQITSNIGYSLRLPLGSTSPYRWPIAEQTTKGIFSLPIAQKTGVTARAFLSPKSGLSKTISGRLSICDVPSAWAILRAASG